MKNVFLCISLALMISVPALFAQTNLIANGEFETDASGWSGWINTGGGARVNFVVDTNSVLSGKNSYMADIDSGTATTYYIQRCHDLTGGMLLGHKYDVNFLAIAVDSAKDSSQIDVCLEMAAGSYTNYLRKTTYIDTLNPTLYTASVIYGAEDATCQLKLHYGGTRNTGDTIWVDSIWVVDQGPNLDTIVVDGQQDPFFAALTGPDDGYIQIQKCHYTENGEPDSNDDLSAKIWAAWDTTWLYIYAEVTDDTVSCPNTANFWRNDCIEFKVDGIINGSATGSPPTTNGLSSTNTITALDTPAATGLASNLEGLADTSSAKQYVRELITGGYVIEMAMNLDSLGGPEVINAEVDSVFGLGINVVDNDGTEASSNRSAAVVWAAVNSDNIWSTPNSLGQVKFLAGKKVSFIATNKTTEETNPLADQYEGDPCPVPSSIDDINANMPFAYSLEQNYPNPFNPVTTIAYSIPVAGKVTVVIYDILGQKVATLVDNQMQTADRYEIQFDASQLATGLYFYSIDYKNQILTRKMLLVK